MSTELTGARIAILVANGFEQSELAVPRERLAKAGATVHIVSPERDRVRGWNHKDWGDEFDVDVQLDEASPSDYDALVLPGGHMNPDTLRMNQKAVRFVREFVHMNKPTAAICHGAWTLVEADVLRGRTVTSYPSIKTDIRNAGASWVDREVAVDGYLVTSRRPDDLEAFTTKLIEVIQTYRVGHGAERTGEYLDSDLERTATGEDDEPARRPTREADRAARLARDRTQAAELDEEADDDQFAYEAPPHPAGHR